ncbi:helix-turn-helix transcriptional regulator [Holdemania sp. 1001302B_160321_E10]|uniref:helix-turn-helix domain-containing protein n=1 Tax=Holdemania sp. 1001302B_160321_E10 TaxID=2787120 RepID=UPI0018988BD9
MTINERVRELRKELRMNQTDFGEKIALTQSHLAGIENEKRTVTDRTIKLICTEFNVSEEWLRTGKKPIFIEINDEDKFSQAFAAASMEEDDFIKALLIEYMDLSKEDRKIVKELIKNIAARTKKSSD